MNKKFNEEELEWINIRKKSLEKNGYKIKKVGRRKDEIYIQLEPIVLKNQEEAQNF